MKRFIIQGRLQLLNLHSDNFVHSFQPSLSWIWIFDLLEFAFLICSISRLSDCFTPHQILLSRCEDDCRCEGHSLDQSLSESVLPLLLCGPVSSDLRDLWFVTAERNYWSHFLCPTFFWQCKKVSISWYYSHSPPLSWILLQYYSWTLRRQKLKPRVVQTTCSLQQCVALQMLEYIS